MLVILNHWKTSLIGASKALAAVGYVVFKLANHQAFSEAECGMIFLALTGAAGNAASADAKQKVDP